MKMKELARNEYEPASVTGGLLRQDGKIQAKGRAEVLGVCCASLCPS
jgi:hypothetical protein